MHHETRSAFLLHAVNGQQEQNNSTTLQKFRRCFVNEEFSECASPCEPTCKNPTPGVCSLQCVAGCQCKTGFLRNELGACVNKCNNQTSKPICGANEEFNECGSACEPTCREPRPIVCTLQCVIGCQCKSGFFRDDRNECVAECDNASSNICAVNEEFKQCGTACEPSCENPKPSVCSAQCVVNVCQCKSGFLRNSKEQCVEHCEEDPCPVTEERKVCGTACEPTCSNPKPKCTKQCINDVCQCRQGFIRNSKNQCIPTSACPPSELPCGRNEERKKCGTACEPTCTNPNPRCTKQCINDVCQCRQGFLRNSENQCIPASECPLSETTTTLSTSCDDFECPEGTVCTTVEESCSEPPCPAPLPRCVRSQIPPMMCGPHESWTNCSGCEPTCSNMNPVCGFSCGRPRCICEEGFFRSDLGSCVTIKECQR
ncbi:hypothetical protein RB195_015822 [Necator americanus]|uniref:EGF-like domain-containing protein n=1 Tax=Necator americanus TaxID=51031 RepID=A0ABR1E6H7_NECAM